MKPGQVCTAAPVNEHGISFGRDGWGVVTSPTHVMTFFRIDPKNWGFQSVEIARAKALPCGTDDIPDDIPQMFWTLVAQSAMA